MPDIAYLASPYSDKSTAVQYDRYSMAVSAVAALVRNGCFVFSPIVHSHPVAMLSDMPGDYAYWQDFDEAMLRRCDRMIVLKLQGWRISPDVLPRGYGRHRNLHSPEPGHGVDWPPQLARQRNLGGRQPRGRS